MENVADVYTLTPLQQGLLYHTINAPGSGVFVDQVGCRLRGGLDRDAFVTAWRLLLRRHDALRTCFLWDGLDAPLQVVRERVDISWCEEDWRGLDDDGRAARLAALKRDDRLRGIDVGEAPLMHMRLLRFGDDDWYWLWCFHHLISDGWSTALLLGELWRDYAQLRGAATPPSTPGFRYRDYVAWRGQRDRTGEEAFWREQLAGLSGPGRWPVYGAMRSDAEALHAQTERLLSADDSAALVALTTRHQVTLSTLMQAAWGLLLSKHSHADDVVFGVTMSGRSAPLEGIEQAVGLFINTLPLRLQIDPSMSLADWLGRLQRKNFELLNWEASSLVDIQRWSGQPAGEALFDSILVFENYPAVSADTAGTGLDITPPVIAEHSSYPLALLVVPGQRLRLIAVHDSARFAADWTADLLAQLAGLLAAFAATPERPLGEFGLGLPQGGERPTAAAALSLGAPATVVEWIFATAASAPAASAVISDQGVLSYRDLTERAGRLAHGLMQQGVARGVRVGVFCDRCPDMLVALLGILRAGGAYVPIDPRYPPAQIRHVVEDAGLRIVLAPSRLLGDWPVDAPLPQAIDALGVDATPLAVDVNMPRADDPAYVIYTSGSSGWPKGVVISHANLLSSTAARVDYYGDVERYLLLPSFAFDSSVAGIFWSLCTGGALALPDEGAERDMERLTTFIAQHAITHLLCLPSLYQLITEHPATQRLATLRCAIVAGEACAAATVRSHFACLPQTSLFNEYGPTEGTVWSTVHRLHPEDGSGPVPIGRPIAGVTLELRDQHAQLVPPGVCGEIWIGGGGLSSGYLNRAELTLQCFVDVDVDADSVAGRRRYRSGDLAWQRADGALMYVGRADGQVKIRGYRVEIAGIEEQLRVHADVREAAVVLAPDVSGVGRRERLLGFVVCAESLAGRADQDAALRAFLTERLPAYMVPERVVVLRELPRLPNGKIDYRALPVGDAAAAAPRHAAAQAQTPEECALAAIWMDLLKLDVVGIDDDFFQLGGDSIISIQMISRARQAGLLFDPQDMVRHTTIRALAAIARADNQQHVTAQVGHGQVRLTPIQAWFFEQDFVRPAHWNMSMLFELTESVDTAALAQAIEACWRHHDALRTRFVQRDGSWVQVIDEQVSEPVIEILERDRCTADAVQIAIERLQASLDIASGPLFKTLIIPATDTQAAQLFVAVHHLVIDAVSWALLSEDITAAYTDIVAQRPVSLPATTTPLIAWARVLEGHAASSAVRTSAAFWLRAGQSQGADYPTEHAAVAGVSEADATTIERRLDAARSAYLLAGANEAYATRVDELIITALARAVRITTSLTELRLGLEWHGRSAAFDGVDLSRTLGWFTAGYPVVLDIRAEDHGSSIKSIKQQLRSVPNEGLDYGVLRYLCADDDLSRQLRAQGEPSLLFNYLGRVRDAGSGRLLIPTARADATSRDPRNRRTHAVEINAIVDAGELALICVYSRLLNRHETIERLIETLIAELAALVDHCRQPDAGGHTPSDFPDVDLSQDDLDAFLDGLG